VLLSGGVKGWASAVKLFSSACTNPAVACKGVGKREGRRGGGGGGKRERREEKRAERSEGLENGLCEGLH
jgi:hypothetical protein